MVGSMPNLKTPVREYFFFYEPDTSRLRQDMLRLPDDVDAHGSRTYGLLTTVEDSGIQLFFQFLYHGAQRGLSDAVMLGRFGKVAEAVDGKDVFQLL